MIELDHVTIRYPDADAPVLRDVHLAVPEGELCLVVGRTGSGKTTLLRAVNGLVPHFTGGTLHGRVTVAGRDTATHPPRELADVVGVVGQDPSSGFVTDVVEDELAYGMESLGLPPATMRRRVEEVLDLLALADLRARPLATLSGGERQRVAIGAVLAAHPAVLVLDEPTSALDPTAAEEVLATLQRLVHDVGLTVLLAEHRLERVVQSADRLVHVPGDGQPVEVGTPGALLTTCPIAPPVVELGRLLGWSPPALSVREARRRLAATATPLALVAPPPSTGGHAAPGEPIAEARRLVVRHGPVVALREVDVTVHAGEVVALMGRNGAGKSTLLGALAGLVRPASGSVRVGGGSVGGEDPAALAPRELVRRVGLVPQEAADLLYAHTVAAECDAADRDAGAAPGTCRDVLERLVGRLDGDAHPRDLSEGERLGLVMSIVLTARPPLLLLDEPTRGLDYAAKGRLVAWLRALAAGGTSVVLSTHDVELAAATSSRTIVLADGEVVAEGPTRDVVTASPAFAPQVAKIMAPLGFLTVEELARALGAAS